MAAADRSNRSASKKNRQSTRLDLERLEARTMCTINNLTEAIALLNSVKVTPTPSNTAPAFVGSVNSSSGATIRGKDTTLSVVARDDKPESQLTYTWAVVSAPSGGAVTFAANNSNAAKSSRATFNKPGDYQLRVTVKDAAGLTSVTTQRFSVVQTLTSLQLFNGNSALSNNGTLTVTGTSQQVTVRGLDQWGNVMSQQPSFAWAVQTSPVGATPKITTVSNTATITFSRAAAYKFSVSTGKLSASFSVTVNQTLSKINVAPGTVDIQAGGKQQFVASAVDQFNATMSVQPTWSTTSGSITSTGMLTAPNAAGKITVTASSGSVRGTSSITVAAPPSQSAINGLATTLFADGSLNRADVIQILRSAGTDGSVSASELSDLRALIADAARYNMPGYVQVLAGNVVNANAANATYLGTTLGNLAAGSTNAVLTMLVDKWFMGTDLPTVTNSSITYRNATGPLFVGTPSRNDEKQGQLGDCYFIATIGALADRNPATINNMFVDNGDGTFTVRFYTGNYSMFYLADGTVSDGFAGGTGVADYVTVNRQLPAYSNGTFAYSNYGRSVTDSTVPLWIALAEKAYAQWNHTGKSGRNGTNTYAAIEGGWMGVVNAQITGTNATAHYMSSATQQTLINALAAGKAVTIGSKSDATALVGAHAYSITGYDANTGRFSLFNPWGNTQPGPLSWADLQANCTMFSVATASSSAIVTNVRAATPTVRGEVTEVICMAALETSTHAGADTMESDSDSPSIVQEESSDQLAINASGHALSPNALATDLLFGGEQDFAQSTRRLSPELVDQALDELENLLLEALA